MLKQKNSTKTSNPESGNGNNITETETEYGIKYQRKKIKELHIAQFSTIQKEIGFTFFGSSLKYILVIVP